MLRGKSQWSQRTQAAKVQGPGRSRCGVEREAAMVTTDARWLAKMQGPVRSRYGVESEAVMVIAGRKCPDLPYAKISFFKKIKEKSI